MHRRWLSATQRWFLSGALVLAAAGERVPVIGSRVRSERLAHGIGALAMRWKIIEPAGSRAPARWSGDAWLMIESCECLPRAFGG